MERPQAHSNNENRLTRREWLAIRGKNTWRALKAIRDKEGFYPTTDEGGAARTPVRTAEYFTARVKNVLDVVQGGVSSFWNRQDEEIFPRTQAGGSGGNLRKLVSAPFYRPTAETTIKTTGGLATAGLIAIAAPNIKLENPFADPVPENIEEVNLTTAEIAEACRPQIDNLGECPSDLQTVANEVRLDAQQVTDMASNRNYGPFAAHAAAPTSPEILVQAETSSEHQEVEVCVPVDEGDDSCFDLEVAGVETGVVEEIMETAEFQEIAEVAVLRAEAGEEIGTTTVMIPEGVPGLLNATDQLPDDFKHTVLDQMEAGHDVRILNRLVVVMQRLTTNGSADNWGDFISILRDLGIEIDFGFSENGSFEMKIAGRNVSTEQLIFPRGPELRQLEFLVAAVEESETRLNLPEGSWWAFAEEESTMGVRPVNRSNGASGVMMQFVNSTLESQLVDQYGDDYDQSIFLNAKDSLQNNPLASLVLAQNYLNSDDRQLYRDQLRLDPESRRSPQRQLENLFILVRALYANRRDHRNREYALELLEGIPGVEIENNTNNPCPSCALSSGYGPRRDPFGVGRRMHSGVDLRGPTGLPVSAVQGGRVRFAGWQRGYGKTVEIDYGSTCGRYAHLSDIDVNVGQSVTRRQNIGNVGSTGRSTGPHLHYELRSDDDCAPGTAVRPPAFTNQITIHYQGGTFNFDTLWRSSQQPLPPRQRRSNNIATGPSAQETTLR